MARHIETVAPNVRNQLDELKRIELERLRKLAMQEHKLEEEMQNGAYDEESGRRWRTVTNKRNQPTNLFGLYPTCFILMLQAFPVAQSQSVPF